MTGEKGPTRDPLDPTVPKDILRTLATDPTSEQARKILEAGAEDPKYVYAAEAWREHTDDTLSEHVVEEHLHPATIAYSGFPRHDIEIARHAGLNLSRVADAIYAVLDEGDEAHARRIRRALVENRLSIDAYKLALFQTLKYLEEVGSISVDWDRVKKYQPPEWKGVVSADKDSSDEPFKPERS
jgi:hypothetical protein